MRIRRALLLLAAPGAVAVSVSAHDLGTTQVTAEFRADGAYQIDIAVDPDALLMKLELAHGDEISAGLPAAERDRRIAALSNVFLDGADVRFDGRSDRPQLEYRPAAAGADRAQMPGLVRLNGRRPSGAQAWTFTYAFASGWFAVETRAGREPARTDWLEGGKEGAAVPLRAARGGSRRILRVLPLFALGAALRAAFSVRRSPL